MILKKIPPAALLKTAGVSNNILRTRDNATEKLEKILPYNSSVLRKYSLANPIFISLSFPCFQYIYSHRGVGLLCNYSPSSYDFSFSRGKEVWVLAIDSSEIVSAKELVVYLLEGGAIKVVILPLDTSLLDRGVSI